MNSKVFQGSAYAICILICATNSAAQNGGVLATWADFEKRHILNPEIPTEAGYANWDRRDWNTFLKKRIADQFGTKTTNSFVIGNNVTILDDLRDGYYQTERHMGISDNLHWSSSKFEVYVMTLVNQTIPWFPVEKYDVHNCSKQFILTGFDEQMVLPVHYQAQSMSRRTRGALLFDLAGCENVRSDEHNFAASISSSVIVILAFLGHFANTFN